MPTTAMRSGEEKSGGSNISSSGGSNNSNCNSNGNTEEEEEDEDEEEEEEDRLRSAWGVVSAALCNAASGTFTARSTRTLAPVRVSATLRL